jgi:hypothetical protein
LCVKDGKHFCPPPPLVLALRRKFKTVKKKKKRSKDKKGTKLSALDRFLPHKK